MDTDKLLLEIHGDLKGVSRDVSHVREKYDSLDARVLALHDRVDGQDDAIIDCQKQIYKGMSIVGGISFIAGIVGHWFKIRIFGS